MKSGYTPNESFQKAPAVTFSLRYQLYSHTYSRWLLEINSLLSWSYLLEAAWFQKRRNLGSPRDQPSSSACDPWRKSGSCCLWGSQSRYSKLLPRWPYLSIRTSIERGPQNLATLAVPVDQDINLKGTQSSHPAGCTCQSGHQVKGDPKISPCWLYLSIRTSI